MTAFLYKPARRILVFLWAGLQMISCSNQPRHAGFDASDALSTFTLAEGFKIEMIAAEPLITDPVDMEIDEYGRMYVVEMHGYPLDKSGSGKIILLNDSDGDGKMDKRTVFKEGLVLPNSIMRWKKGVLVTDSPALLYLEDSNNDGVADRMDTVITGFALTNPQHNANSPVYGMDNWIYVAHEGEVSTRSYKEEFGDVGREIVFAADTNAARLPRNANGLSIRLKPSEKKLEMLSSKCQFGHTFDAWGRLFECDNSNHVYQEVIADRYFRRNEELTISNSTQSLSDHLNAAEVFPVTTNPDRQLLTDVGVMTSACGVTTYLGGAFGPELEDAVFTAEPVSNLVHVDKLRYSGSTFRASRMIQNKEFLASTDAWSRPVNFYVGPDGALYVLDYYRKVIESPEWMSDEAIAAGGLYDGTDKGRIYRITPKHGISPEWMKGLQLGEAGPAQLVEQLGNTNYWWRINAQRLLVDRLDSTSVPLLIKMANGSSPAGRLHALWTLEGLNALNENLIMQALKDPVAGIRENAIKLAEPFIVSSPHIRSALLQLNNDSDAKVRLQLLLTLGFINTQDAAEVRNQILFRDVNDKWTQIAALTSPASNGVSLLNEVLSRYKDENDAYGSLVERLSQMIGSSANPSVIRDLVSKYITSSSKKNAAVIRGIASGMRNRDSIASFGSSLQQSLVQSFFGSPSADMRLAAFALLQIEKQLDTALLGRAFLNARKIMNDTSVQYQRRAEAIDFLGLRDPSNFMNDLQRLLNSTEEPQVQLAALRTLGKSNGTAVSHYLVKRWPELTPEIRSASVNTFLSDSARITVLIDALEKNVIQTSSIPFGTSVFLMQNEDEGLRNRARAIFTKTQRDREKVNKEYANSLKIEGDPVTGREVFVKNCAICHQVRGKIGVAIGPDLGTVHNWSKEDVLANVLDPNMAIASGFDTWTVTLKDGEVLQGLIAAETPVAITLRNSGQLDKTVNRQDIQSLRSTNTSSMPAGLEKNINKQQMADLLAFLRRNQDFK